MRSKSHDAASPVNSLSSAEESQGGFEFGTESPESVESQQSSSSGRQFGKLFGFVCTR